MDLHIFAHVRENSEVQRMTNSAAGSSSKARVGPSQPSESSSKRKRGMFQKDLQHVMYGFGDEFNPLPKTVALVEDIVVEYVTCTTRFSF
ncbi:transcription initiation factor TFIID subunit 13-like [Primulina tabacum]|uniref:transcription initiation factor TFIID subunit 13-like n=1 Tax=Primulina tabacum TaxID=48773 RepID=UPI003F59CA0D